RKGKIPWRRVLCPGSRPPSPPEDDLRSRNPGDSQRCPGANRPLPLRSSCTTLGGAAASEQTRHSDGRASTLLLRALSGHDLGPVGLATATTSGQREPRERRRRQMPAPTRRQGSRRSIQETPYSPDSRIAGMPNERAGSTAAGCSRPPDCDAPASTVE